MSEQETQVETKAKKGKKAKVITDSAPVAAKVLLTFAKQLPAAELELGTESVRAADAKCQTKDSNCWEFSPA